MPAAGAVGTGAEPGRMTASILLSRDPELLDDVGRLAAVTGLDDPVVIGSPAEAGRWWAQAPFVLVGSDLLGEAAARRARPPTGAHGRDPR